MDDAADFFPQEREMPALVRCIDPTGLASKAGKNRLFPKLESLLPVHSLQSTATKGIAVTGKVPCGEPTDLMMKTHRKYPYTGTV